MRKLAITLSAVFLLVSANSFATTNNETKVSAKAKTSFEKDFNGAENATWVKKDDVYFVTFDVDSKHNEAAYNEQGDLIAVSKTILLNEMPVAVRAAINNQYAGYDIAKNATEVVYNNETSYYINVANDTQLLKLKCTVNGDITVDRETKR